MFVLVLSIDMFVHHHCLHWIRWNFYVCIIGIQIWSSFEVASAKIFHNMTNKQAAGFQPSEREVQGNMSTLFHRGLLSPKTLLLGRLVLGFHRCEKVTKLWTVVVVKKCLGSLSVLK